MSSIIFGHMKAHIIVFVALIMLAKPIWPIAEYVINYDYIANVLCENKEKPQLNCDGKCYLAKQLAKEMDRNEDNPFGEKQSKAEVQPILFFQSFLQINLKINTFIVRQENYSVAQTFISNLFTIDIAQPPEFC